ncbi:transglycosylase SLT domain-containing protein [Knoellia locipacati]|uniref:Transglycosylase SLT domain-containing protein n=1 Tax=Knoellia locipacati TaxID=882824 RepID=A0A512SX37_9MICO|nr:hypothetical protein [Knoellia locipacati]GEQ12522.1 hypothetical protein KLO01_05690 [Knoellia locipacati]
MNSRYRGRHRGRHARPSEAPLTVALGVARRPAVTAAMALALVGTGAVGVSANDAVADSEPFTLSSSAMTQAALSARESATDSARISRDRAGVNTQRAAASAKAQAAADARAAADAAAAKAKAEALAKARAAAAQKVAREKARASAIANAQKDPRSAARALMSDQGWGDGQWRCLNLLWEGESSWDHTAENSSSGAYGIPQSLPASKMAKFGSDYRTNPITQITWGLWYIKQSYGTPCNAWDQWQARSPHWY